MVSDSTVTVYCTADVRHQQLSMIDHWIWLSLQRENISPANDLGLGVLYDSPAETQVTLVEDHRLARRNSPLGCAECHAVPSVLECLQQAVLIGLSVAYFRGALQWQDRWLAGHPEYLAYAEP